MARPSKLDYWLNDHREALEKILGTCKTDREIFKALGIDKTTFYRWKETNTTFKELYEIKKKECQDKIARIKLEDAEQNLLNLVKGTCEEVTTTEELMHMDDGSYKLVVTKKVTKKLAPNVTAIIFALKNLDPAKWKDRPVGDDGSQDEDNKINELLDKISEGVSTNASNK